MEMKYKVVYQTVRGTTGRMEFTNKTEALRFASYCLADGSCEVKILKL